MNLHLGRKSLIIGAVILLTGAAFAFADGAYWDNGYDGPAGYGNGYAMGPGMMGYGYGGYGNGAYAMGPAMMGYGNGNGGYAMGPGMMGYGPGYLNSGSGYGSNLGDAGRPGLDPSGGNVSGSGYGAYNGYTSGNYGSCW